MPSGWWDSGQEPALKGEADQIGATELQAASVATAKLQDGAVTEPKLGASAVSAAKLADGAVELAKLGLADFEVARFVDVTIPTGELLALNETPKVIVAAPGAGLAVVPAGPVALVLMLDFESAAYDGIAAGEDLSLKYTGSAGTELIQVEATGFLDSTEDAVAFAAPGSLVTPEEDEPVVLHMLAGEIATGDSPLHVRFYYRHIPTTLGGS